MTLGRSALAAVGNTSLPRKLTTFLRNHLRYEVLLILFVVMSINQADRAAMAIASPGMARQFHLDQSSIGWLFSSFAWAYMIFQLVGGWLIDRYGAKRSYSVAIFLWSAFTLLIGVIPSLDPGCSVIILYLLIFLIGAAAAPSFPANSKFVAAWFPTRERGTASSAITSTQYFASAVFTPLMAWVASSWNWKAVYLLMGGLGILVGILFVRRVHAPAAQPRITNRELEELRAGSATLDLEPLPVTTAPGHGLGGITPIKRMFSQRMMIGIFIGQYGISTLTFFFLTWFPVYLVQQRDIPLLHAGMLASVPALFGFIGGITGGAISDALLRKGLSLSMARKLPIYIGMGISCCIVACNYLDSNAAILSLMTLAYFGKGMGAQGWAIIADTAPVNATGLAASIFNTFSSAAGIITPIAIGYLVQRLHSFNGALIFVGLHALLAVLAFAFITGPLKRMGNI